MEKPESIAREYFSRVRRGDLSVVDLFHDDAELLGLGARTRGKDSIREFYAKSIAEGGPQPSEPVTLLADATKALAEVTIELRDGSTIHAIDLFKIEEDRIRELTYFIAEHPAA